MGKYFGTDGVRGEANVELTPELAFKLGRFGGYVLSQHETGRPKVFVARDTRISGEMLESALVAGLLSVGIEVYKLGVLATPGVSYLVRTENASAGVMISASHNPALDNGIKFFGEMALNWMMRVKRKLKPFLMQQRILFHVRQLRVLEHL
ncbi:Phosphoglucosamine mutase [Streptococcus sp. HSISS2]|nr:Phosphoglucosamine mutase [Streptococcus sp. HSISS2]